MSRKKRQSPGRASRTKKVTNQPISQPVSQLANQSGGAMGRLAAAGAVVVIVLAVAGYFWFSEVDPTPAPVAETREFIAGADLGYADPVACIGCHAEIHETYSRTGMGRSFYRPTEQNIVEDFATDNTYYHEPSERYYTMIARDGEYVVRRHQLGPSGEETNILEKKINYVLGSGIHSRSYLWRTADGGLAQLPVSWYSENGGYWAMSPGYDRPDHQGFLREAATDCIACHNAFPMVEEGSDQQGAELRYPADMPEGIDCQRCHGPGREHLEVMEGAEPSAEAIQASIVNPARLDADRQLEVCMQCHLETTVEGLPHAMRRPGRGAFSYQAGQPLGEFAVHFDYEPDKGPDDLFEIAHAAYRLRKSACFQQSGGEMTCTTCHNPHDIRHGAEASAEYIAACRGCHTASFDEMVEAGRHPRDGDCLDCHMAKRRPDDVVRVAMTDHFIRRKQPARNLLASKKESHDEPYRGRVMPYYPPGLPASPDDELVIASAQVVSQSNLEEGIRELEQAIREHKPGEVDYQYELAEAYGHTGRTDDAVAAYREVLQRDPTHQSALEGLGRLLAQSGRAEEAISVLRQAISHRPGAYQIHSDLGLAYVNSGRPAPAIKELRTAVRINPDTPQSQSGLGAALIQTGDVRGAEQAFRRAIRLNPSYANAHANLANVLAGTNRPADAEHHFQQALRFDPEAFETHFSYSRLLAATDRLGEAEKRLQSALRINPSVVEAHDELGTIFALQGKTMEAISTYRKALDVDPRYGLVAFNLGALLLGEGRGGEAKQYFIQALETEPNLAEAHLNLGNQYAMEGQFSAAEQHLRQAASSADPALQQAAQDSLSRLRAAKQRQ